MRALFFNTWIPQQKTRTNTRPHIPRGRILLWEWGGCTLNSLMGHTVSLQGGVALPALSTAGASRPNPAGSGHHAATHSGVADAPTSIIPQYGIIGYTPPQKTSKPSQAKPAK